MFIVFFKRNTAYEMRISDWSSDVVLFRSDSPAYLGAAMVTSSDPGPDPRGNPRYDPDLDPEIGRHLRILHDGGEAVGANGGVHPDPSLEPVDWLLGDASRHTETRTLIRDLAALLSDRGRPLLRVTRSEAHTS